MAKLNINDLRYIVMEGGGARGNTYLGAIIALEEQLKKRHEDNPAIVSKVPDMDMVSRSNTYGIMDYLEKNDDGEDVPVIRGVAGASAGAITTFALTLGLNSKEILEVLKLDFTNFLKETDTAKYRMIGANSELMVGEDSKIDVADDPAQVKDYALSKVKVVGGKRSKPFNYRLDKNKTRVRGNFFKGVIRTTVVNLVLKVIFDGLVNNLGKVIPIVKKWKEDRPLNGGLADKTEKVLEKVGAGDNAAPVAGFVENFIYSTAIKQTFYQSLNIALPVKFGPNAISGLILDRGLYSGFQVREFFYDLMLYAATRDTLFQRKLIETYSGKPISTGTYTFDKSDLIHTNFEIGKRTRIEDELKPKAKALFKHLQNLTFEEFYEITGIDYGAAVSNHTRDTMLYFSHNWTPQFRVLEAVGASMTIPPAIRAVYNASDVYFNTGKPTPGQVSFPRRNPHKSIYVKVNGEPVKFVNSKGQFKKTDYDLYAYIIKKALQQDLLDGPDKSFVDLNNGLELHAFLPKLRDMVVGERKLDDEGYPFREKLSLKNRKVMVNGNEYEVDLELLTFFYNAQFKGLLIDGGYRNNIPFNYFRDRNPELKGVLAIKLDGNYPPDFLALVHPEIEHFLRNENEFLQKVEDELFQLSNIPGFRQLKNIIRNQTFKRADILFEKLIKRVERRFNQYMNQPSCPVEFLPGENADSFKVDRGTVLKLIRQWIKTYGSENYVKPWAKAKSILATAMEGYSYGSERGQVREFSDHNHIISLYDFGVGTYDFELEKVITQAGMSQTKAREALHCYFHDAV